MRLPSKPNRSVASSYPSPRRSHGLPAGSKDLMVCFSCYIAVGLLRYWRRLGDF